MCGWTQRDMFLGGEFLMRQVSINALWWLAFAMMVSAALNRLPLTSMKLVVCVSASLSSTGVSICASGCNWMDLFRIPDKLMWVTLSLSEISL